MDLSFILALAIWFGCYLSIIILLLFNQLCFLTYKLSLLMYNSQNWTIGKRFNKCCIFLRVTWWIPKSSIERNEVMRQRTTTKTFLLPWTRCNFTRNWVQRALDNCVKWKIPVPLIDFLNKSLKLMLGLWYAHFI